MAFVKQRAGGWSWGRKNLTSRRSKQTVTDRCRKTEGRTRTGWEVASEIDPQGKKQREAETKTERQKDRETHRKREGGGKEGGKES